MHKKPPNEYKNIHITFYHLYMKYRMATLLNKISNPETTKAKTIHINKDNFVLSVGKQRQAINCQASKSSLLPTSFSNR